MNLDGAMQTFLVECEELLEQMETLLLHLESEPDDREALNGVFRAAHTIKGSSGLFGLDPIVGFTHVVENLLDKVRGGEIPLSGMMVSTLLECRDHIGTLVQQVAAENGTLDAAAHSRGEKLKDELKLFIGQQVAPVKDEMKTPAEVKENVESKGGGVVESDTWHISVRFGFDVLRGGMDPLSFVRYLGTLGNIVSVHTITDNFPPAEEMDPESCYLGFEIDLQTNADKKTIEDVFEFVRDDCQLYILPPNSKLEDYIELITKLPENEARIGDLLVASGALTHKELEMALACQEVGCMGQPGLPLGQILVDQNFVQKPVVEAALEKQKQVKEVKAQEAKFIRVHADKLDQLINLVGELVIAGAGANLLAQRSRDGALLEATSTVAMLVEEIRDGALKLRMVEIGETFSRFQRVVRDVSKELGKEVALVINGGETELDKTVVEKIGDPLMHLVRNAMDHGIENDVALRLSRGKSAKGTVRLNAFHDSGSIVIEVGDDGSGLNRARILKKAIEKNLISPEQTLSDTEVFNLIFEPGFSTAEAVTNLSGRGVGMDVVKRNIMALRGLVEIDSREGVGTTVRIRLPLTLAIIDGFLVGVGKSSFVVPLDMVLECVELSDAEREATRENHYLNLRGEVLPFIRLSERFDIEGAGKKRENVMVVQYGRQKAGLVVDELFGEFQTVIKPLGKIFRHLKGISGSTILGTGEVALILDVPALLSHAAEMGSKGSRMLEVH